MNTYEITVSDPATGAATTRTVEADSARYDSGRAQILFENGTGEHVELVGLFGSVTSFIKTS